MRLSENNYPARPAQKHPATHRDDSGDTPGLDPNADPCLKVEMLPTEALKPYARNARTTVGRGGPIPVGSGAQSGLWQQNLAKLEAGGSRGSSNILMAYDFDPVHDNPGSGYARCYLYADGHLE